MSMEETQASPKAVVPTREKEVLHSWGQGKSDGLCCLSMVGDW